MKKTEMTKEQVTLFKYILNFLENKGWKYDGDISWFERDEWEEPEIGMVYSNLKTNIGFLIEYTINEDLMTLILTDLETGKEVMFDIFPEKKLNECLDFLTQNQDTINSKDFQDYIRRLLDICPKIFTYKGDKAYRLKPE